MTVNKWGFPVGSPSEQDGFGSVGTPYPEPSKDVISAPDHYTYGGIETIDYLQAKMGSEEFKGYLRGNVLKYLSRAGHKDNVVQDYKKAAVYLNWLIKYIETNNIK